MRITQACVAAAAFLALSCTWASAQPPAQLPRQSVDQALRARLPKEILEKGELISVNSGSFPPYEIVGDAGTLTGASADLSEALGELLGVRIRHETVNGLAGILAGIKSGRYQLAAGPIGDFPEREAQNDFVDFVQEYVVFAVQKGNPKGIRSLSDTCGNRISVMAAGSAERVIKQQAEACVKEGKPAVEVQSFPDQPTAMLAVRSKRSDGFFSSQAPLSYFVQQAHGQLELAATGEKNGFEDLYQGTVVPKDSALGAVVLDGYKTLFANGTYAAVMKKWGLEGNMLKAPGLNLAGRKSP
jgi:polar amino acid transport system substrate-binding protein